MKFTKLALSLLCSMVLFCACSKDSDIVLKVNDEPITKKEYYSDFNRIKQIQFKSAPKEMQKDDSYPILILKDRYTNDVIIRKLLTQEFDKRNITATKEEVDAKKKSMTEQIGSAEQLQKILKENNISEERFTQDMTSEVKIEKLIEALGGSKVSDKEVQDFYNKNKGQFTTPERVEVAHILIDTNPENIKRQITDADKDAKLSSSDIDSKVQAEIQKRQALAKEVRAKAAANPKNFAALAKEYSQDPASAQKGGDLGFIVEGQMVPEFTKAAFSQKVGVVGPLVKTQFGEHIILVKDKSAKGVQSFAQVKDDLNKFLVNQKKGQVIQKFIDGLKTTAKIEYVDPSLRPEVLQKQAQEALQRQLDQEKAKADKNNKGSKEDAENK